MGSAPQPPIPPAAPVPPRSGSNVLAIVLLSLALIVVVSALAVWIGLRFLTHNVQVHVNQDGGARQEVSIKTLFEIKHSDLERVVALQSEGEGTRIELVRVAHGRQEGN